MRNIIFLLTLVFASIAANAQKINSRGEKMVDKIEVFVHDFKTKELRKSGSYAFTYDGNNNIVGMVRKNGDEEHRFVKKDHTTLSYSMNICGKPADWGIKLEFLLDDSGNIIQKVYYDGLKEAITIRQTWNFYYSYDDFSGRCRVDSTTDVFTYREPRRGIRDFVMEEGVTEPITLKVKRDDYGLYCVRHLDSSSTSVEKTENYDLSVPDDTNLNLNYLLVGSNSCSISGCGVSHYEFIIPEWINIKSGCLVASSGTHRYDVTKDKKGNIVQIDEVNPHNGRLDTRWVISYK